MTARLRMEVLRVEHADLAFDQLLDERIYAYIPDRRYTSKAELQAQYERLVQGPKPGTPELWLNWLMFDMHTGSVVGTLQATVFPEKKLAYVAYGVFPQYWKRGYGTEGLGWLLEHLKSRGDVERAEAYIDTRNEASIQLVRRLKFEFRETEKNEDSEDHIFEKKI